MHSQDADSVSVNRDEVSLAGPQSRTSADSAEELAERGGGPPELPPAQSLEKTRRAWERDRASEEALYRQWEEKLDMRLPRRRPPDVHEYVEKAGGYPSAAWRQGTGGGNELWNGLASVQGQLPSQALPRYRVLCKGHEVESDFQDGFHVDGTWHSAYEFLHANRAPTGRKREGDAWTDPNPEAQTKTEFLRAGGWHVVQLSEQKRRELRKRLRTWLKLMPLVSPSWEYRGPGRKGWDRTLARHRRNRGRWWVILLYAQWELTQEQIAELFGGTKGIPKSAKTIAKIIHDEERNMELLERLDLKLDRVLDNQDDLAQAMKALQANQEQDEDTGPDLYVIEGQG